MPELAPRPTGFKPTPKGHPKFGARTLTEAFDVAGLRLKPLSQIQPFNYIRAEVPNLDQGQTNECVPTTWTMVTWVWLVKMGFNPPPLSPASVYSYINSGVDEGSAPGDAITTLQTHGVAPASMVPPGILGPAGYNSRARAAALSFRLGPCVRIQTMQELVNGMLLGLIGGLDVCAGPTFMPDARGIVPVLDGPNNHEVFVGEAFARVDGKPVVRARNPWGMRIWLTEEHVARAQEIDLATGALTDRGLPPLLI